MLSDRSLFFITCFWAQGLGVEGWRLQFRRHSEPVDVLEFAQLWSFLSLDIQRKALFILEKGLFSYCKPQGFQSCS